MPLRLLHDLDNKNIPSRHTCGNLPAAVGALPFENVAVAVVGQDRAGEGNSDSITTLRFMSRNAEISEAEPGRGCPARLEKFYTTK